MHFTDIYSKIFLTMKQKYKDSEILSAMLTHVDEDIMTYGARGNYSIGAYYDIIGDNYNTQENLDSASATTAAELFRTDENKLDDGLQAAIWLKEI